MYTHTPMCVCVCDDDDADLFTPERPPHTRTARAQSPAAHRRRYSRPHHLRQGEHSPKARHPHSMMIYSPPKDTSPTRTARAQLPAAHSRRHSLPPPPQTRGTQSYGLALTLGLNPGLTPPPQTRGTQSCVCGWVSPAQLVGVERTPETEELVFKYTYTYL